MKIEEVAELLSISKVTAYRLIEKREIPYYKVGGGLRFSREDILDYLAKNRTEPIKI